jgi:hypothetical protein
VRAVDRDPAKLEQVVRLVKDLCEQPGGADLLPEGFLSVWAPIRAAYERSRT